MYKCSRKVRLGSHERLALALALAPSPSPSRGLLDLLNAMNSELAFNSKRGAS